MLARLLAASPDDSVRDGRRAFEILAEITAVVQSPQVMETTAMAAAEVGLFDDAARYQGMAIEMATQAGLAALAAQWSTPAAACRSTGTSIVSAFMGPSRLSTSRGGGGPARRVARRRVGLRAPVEGQVGLVRRHHLHLARP